MAKMDESVQVGQVERLAALAGEVRHVAKKRGERLVTPAELAEFCEHLPLLTELTGTAGHDHRARAEAISRAVVHAAVDLCDGVRRNEQPGLNDREVSQLQYLLGLTPESERLPWHERLVAAAAVQHVNLETFRKKPLERLLYLLAVTLSSKSATTSTENEFGAEDRAELHIFDGHQTLHPWLTRYIRETKPRDARLVLYSAVASMQVLCALRDVEADITLIMSHPDVGISPWYRNRIRTSVQEMRRYEFSDYEKLKIYLFRVPPSIRGWRIGEYIGLGWYVYRDNSAVEIGDPEQISLRGHDSISLVHKVTTPPGDRLAAWFDQEADNLIHHRLTIREEQYNLDTEVWPQAEDGALKGT
jgi:hypothetical protein